MIRFTVPVAAAAALALLPAAATAATPVQGSVFGPIVSVQGTTFTLTTSLSPSGKSKVTVGKATITEQSTAPRSSLKVGACVSATGARNSKGVVAATRITISAPVKGQCGTGFGGGRGSGPPRTGTVPRTGHGAEDGHASSGRLRRRELRLRIRVGDEGERLDPHREGPVVRIDEGDDDDGHGVCEDVSRSDAHGERVGDQGEDVRLLCAARAPTRALP